MDTENDIATLIELLKMSAERWPRLVLESGPGGVFPE